MTSNDMVAIITALVTAVNTIVILYFAFKKLRPEVKKLEVDVDSGIVDAANLNLEGAKISAQMLLDRINELKIELDQEKKARREEQALNEKTRRDDAEYFRRRIKDVERESRDYRNWAAKLTKQVIEAGQIPVPFIPSMIDTDPAINKPRPDLEAN